MKWIATFIMFISFGSFAQDLTELLGSKQVVIVKRSAGQPAPTDLRPMLIDIISVNNAIVKVEGAILDCERSTGWAPGSFIVIPKISRAKFDTLGKCYLVEEIMMKEDSEFVFEIDNDPLEYGSKKILKIYRNK